METIAQRLANIEGNFNNLIEVLRQASQATQDDIEVKNKLNEISEQNKVLIEAVNELLKLLTAVFRAKDFGQKQEPANQEPGAGQIHPKLQAGMPIAYQRTK